MIPPARPTLLSPSAARRIAKEQRARMVRYGVVGILGAAAMVLAGWSAVLGGMAYPALDLTPTATLAHLAVITPVLTATISPTPTVFATTVLTSSVEAVTIPPPELPASVKLDVPNHKQERQLSCELRSATDLALYYGKEITWQQLFLEVGNDLNGDPNVGFAGKSIDDPSGGIYPDGYGVHAAPIARGLQALGIPATAHNGQTMEWLQSQLAAGNPVVVWATAGLIPSRRVEWQTQDGRTVWGVPWEHTFIVVGYDERGIWLNDPFTATTDYYYWNTFQTAWALLDNMAVTIEASPL